MNAHAGPSSLPPLSLSILGVEPLDEFIKEIADFIHYQIASRPEGVDGTVEVEAKVGILRDTRSGERFRLPLLVESILAPDLDIRFESNMAAWQHRHYNNMLNMLKTSASTPTPMEYSHLYLVDTFYPDSSGVGESGDKRLRGSDKVRVTRNEKTNEVVQIVKKVRLGDLNIFSPKREMDWRISVNMEIKVPHPLGSSAYTRKKDRLCYSHEEFIIDLTQVTHNAPGAAPQVLHELELEIARSDLLISTAMKRNDISYSEHERSAFDELIRAFVNNARILVRNAPMADQPGQL